MRPAAALQSGWMMGRTHHLSRPAAVNWGVSSVQTDDTPPISQTDIQKAMEELVDTGVLPEVYDGDSLEDDLK